MKHKVTRLLCILLLTVAHSISFVRPASAEVVQNYWETVSFTRYNDCTGEQVEGVFEIHWLWIVNQGRVDSIHTNVRGTAVGTSTGNRYLYRHNYKDDYANFVCGGTATERANSRMISLGSAPNLDMDILVTVGLDANCNPLPPIVTVDLHCKG